MRHPFVALLLIPLLCNAQSPLPPGQSSASPSANTPSAAQAVEQPASPSVVTVAPGTSVAMTLASPIHTRSTQPGDAVRAVVAFPVTVGSQLAIPAGTYVQGVVHAVHPRPSHGHPAGVELQFTSLLLANGYTVNFDAVNQDARNSIPDSRAIPDSLAAELADARDGALSLGEGFEGEGQYPPPPPPLPPLPQTGPNPAVIGGAIGGGLGITALTLILTRHHEYNTDLVLFGSGWQFQMVLREPLTLDAAQVSAAAKIPAGQ